MAVKRNKHIQDVRTMTRFDILRELRELELAEEERSETLHASSVTIQRLPENALVRKTLLKHQLKLLDMKTAEDEDAKALEEYWRRQAEEERKKQEAEAEAEAQRLEIAKTKAKEEIQADVDELAEVLAGLPKDKLKQVLKTINRKSS